MSITAGQRVETSDGAGYVYSIEHDWAGVILDRNAGRSNPPIFWVKLEELQQPAPAQPHTFKTPHEQYAARNGQACTILRAITEPDATHDEEVLPMYVVQFGDGQTIEAWPDELKPQAQPANSLEAMQQEASRRKAGSFNTPAERKAWLQSFGQEQQ